MAEKNKRPIVYVAREFIYCDDNNKEMLGGYYVSKAYLHFAGKEYNEDGTISKEFKVDFVNRYECLDKKDDEVFCELYAEISDVKATKREIFKDYASCKKYVNEQNLKMATAIGTTSASKVVVRMEFYKQAYKYAAALEEKYIPAEEREQASESTTNI